MKFSSTAIASFWLTSFFANNTYMTYMIEWLEDKVIWLRLTITRYFLSRKEQESVVFVKEEFLAKKIKKKKMFSFIFDHKIADTEEGGVKQILYGCL